MVGQNICSLLGFVNVLRTHHQRRLCEVQLSLDSLSQSFRKGLEKVLNLVARLHATRGRSTWPQCTCKSHNALANESHLITLRWSDAVESAAMSLVYFTVSKPFDRSIAIATVRRGEDRSLMNPFATLCAL